MEEAVLRILHSWTAASHCACFVGEAAAGLVAGVAVPSAAAGEQPTEEGVEFDAGDHVVVVEAAVASGAKSVVDSAVAVAVAFASADSTGELVGAAVAAGHEDPEKECVAALAGATGCD